MQSGLMYTIGCFFTARRDRLFRLRDVDFRTHFHIHQHVFSSRSLSLSPKNTQFMWERGVRRGKKSFAEQGANDVWRRRNEKLYNVLRREYKPRCMRVWVDVPPPQHIFILSRSSRVTSSKRELEPRGLAKNESFYNFFWETVESYDLLLLHGY